MYLVWVLFLLNLFYFILGILVYYDVFVYGMVNMLLCNKMEKILFELDFFNFVVSLFICKNIFFLNINVEFLLFDEYCNISEWLNFIFQVECYDLIIKVINLIY